MRRLISLFLCLTVVFSCLAGLTAFAADATGQKEAVQKPDTEDMILLKALGIFPQDMVAGVPITRNELAKIYFSILQPTMAGEEYIAFENNFTDMGNENYQANYVAKAGIMNGVSKTEFNPDGTLSYIEMVKTLVCFLGYRDMAEAQGGWPFGYNYCGVKFGFSDYADSGENYVSTEVAAALFVEAINVNTAYITYSSNGTATVLDEGMNYLEKYLKIYTRDGIVTGHYLEDLRDTDDSTDYYAVNIDGGEYLLSEKVQELKENIGRKVRVYAKQLTKDHTPDILYYKILTEKEHRIEVEDLIGYNSIDRTLEYYDASDRVMKYDIRSAYVIYNNSLCESYDADVINPFKQNPDFDGYITVVDNDDDRKAEAVVVRAFQSYVVSRISKDKIYNTYHPEVIFDIKKLEDGKVAVKNVVGQTIPLSAIAKDTIISVFLDKEGEIKEIIVAVDYYKGTVQEIIKNKNYPFRVKVDGVYFDFANRLANENQGISDVRVGGQVVLYFDFTGRVCDIETALYSDIKYGYLIEAETITESFSSETKVLILTAQNKFLVSPLRKTVYINDIAVKAENAPSVFGFETPGKIVRQPVKYIYNEEKDYVTDIWLVDPSLDQYQDGFYKYNLGTSNLTYKTVSKSFSGKLVIGSGIVYFVVPPESKRDDLSMYNATGTSIYSNNSTFSPSTHAAYGTEAYNPVPEVIVKKRGETEKPYSLNTRMVITDIETSINDDGDVQTVWQGYVSGSLKSYPLDDDVLITTINGAEIEVGDFVVVGLNKKSRIGGAEQIFDASTKTISTSYSGRVFYDDYRFVFGKVNYFKNDIMTIEHTSKESFNVGGNFFEYDDSGRDIKFVKSSSSILHDEKHNDYPAYVFMYTTAGSMADTIVFHN